MTFVNIAMRFVFQIPYLPSSIKMFLIIDNFWRNHSEDLPEANAGKKNANIGNVIGETHDVVCDLVYV